MIRKPLDRRTLPGDAVVSSNDVIGRISQRLKTFIDELRKVIATSRTPRARWPPRRRRCRALQFPSPTNRQWPGASAEEVTATVEEVSAGVEKRGEEFPGQFDRLSGFIEPMQRLSAGINEMGDKLKETLLFDRNRHPPRNWGRNRSTT